LGRCQKSGVAFATSNRPCQKQISLSFRGFQGPDRPLFVAPAAPERLDTAGFPTAKPLPQRKATPLQPLTAHPSGPLRGRARPPGDKSISHRALMLGGSAIGETHITGLLEGEDVLGTAEAMRKLGATVERRDDGTCWGAAPEASSSPTTCSISAIPAPRRASCSASSPPTT
jgi:hypothetical protein